MPKLNYFIGTSGYSYKEWKGNFYPNDLSNKKMLDYYSKRFNTVEINNTFYRMPKLNVIDSWRNEVPPDFKFIIKSPRRITHKNKLEVNDSAKFFIDNIVTLKPKLGVLLFQLPPYFKKDIDKLKTFIDFLPENIKVAFEFRNSSWFDDELYKILKSYNYSLCMADTDEEPIKEIISTADWGYIRLRRSGYNAVSLKKWSNKILTCGWKEAYILFKHEDEGKGPKFAKKFQGIVKNL